MSLTDTVTLNDGRKMPYVGLGTWRAPPEEAENAVLWALEAGYRHIDTAAVYKNEESVGEAIRKSGVPREDIWVTTKLYPEGKDYDKTLAACDESLQKLGLEYVDLYLIHAPINVEQRLNQWRALEKLKEDGKARSIGVSNYGAHHLDQLFKEAKIIPAVNQFELTPYLQRVDLVNKCREHNIAVEAYSSLTQGKKLDDPPLVEIANRHNKSTAKVLLKWALQKGYIILPKSVTKGRIQDNTDLFSFTLSQQDMDDLDKLEQNLVLCWDPISGP